MGNDTCECVDVGCKGSAAYCSKVPRCGLLYRVDMGPAGAGLVFCEPCGDDALESGLFVETSDDLPCTEADEAQTNALLATTRTREELDHMLFQVDYTVRDRDDKRDQTEHDIEAATPQGALLAFLCDFLCADPTFVLDLEDEERTLEDWSSYYTNHKGMSVTMAFWSEDCIIEVDAVRIEDTRICPTCKHSGEVGRVRV